MTKTIKRMFIFFLLMGTLWFTSSNLFAKGEGTSSGNIFLEPNSARPAALGEAFSAVSNDLSAFSYNPASLKTLENGQASFLYEKGLFDTSYGNFMIGSPSKNDAFGLSVSYYNSGTIELYDGSMNHTMNAKKDVALTLGYATKSENMLTGFSGKYLSSEVLGKKASAFAGDVGLQMPLTNSFRIGAALQNIGTQLKYVHEANELPRMARAGMSWNLIHGAYTTTLLLDASYFMNEREIKPAMGLETLVGPMSLRAGYQSRNDLQNFSFGAGFNLGQTTLDYSYALMKNFDVEHRVSLSFRFEELRKP